MRRFAFRSEALEVPAPVALGAILIVAGMTKGGCGDLAIGAMLAAYVSSVTARQLANTMAESGADGRPDATPRGGPLWRLGNPEWP